MSPSTPIEVAQRFASARARGDQQAHHELLSLLDPQVVYEVLGAGAKQGAEAVADALLHGPNGALSQKLDWQTPVADAEKVRLTGLRKPQTQDRGLVVTLGFNGPLISLVQDQRTLPPLQADQPLALTEDIKRRVDHALAERHPMLVSHLSTDGQPVLTFRGSVQSHSDDQLAMWIRSPQGGFIQAIRAHPKIALMYRDEEAKATYQFQGRASVNSDPAVRQSVFDRLHPAERAHDFAMLGVAVIVDLDRIEGYSGLGPMGQVGIVRMSRQTLKH